MPAPERSVFARMLAITGAFADAPPEGLLPAELAGRTGLPPSTVYRLCGRLERERVLERRADGRYHVGLRLWELGLLAPRSQGLREVALPFLEDLHEVTRQNVQLMVLDGADAVVVERLASRDAVRLEGRAGGRLPAHATSGGIVLVAAAGEPALKSLLRHPLQAFTSTTITTEPVLRATVSLARRQGWIVLDGHITPGSVSVAAPVTSRRDGVVAAVSVVSEAHEGQALVAALLTTSRAIGRSLA